VAAADALSLNRYGEVKVNSMSATNHMSASKWRLFEKYTRGQMASPISSPDAITPRPTDRPARLSVAQQEFCSQETNSPGIPPLYNESITVHMKGALDVRILERSFAEIIRRHEIWRTTYAKRDRQLVQIIRLPEETFRLSIQDFRGMSESERMNEMRKFIDRDTRRPFNFERGPLLRASLLQMSTEDRILFIVAHLSVVDGVSVYQILPTELAVLYEAFSAGRNSPLPELPVQFADFADWQREHLESHKWEDQIAFWKKQLDGPPVLNWPRDHTRQAVTKTFRGMIRSFAFSDELTEQIKYLSRTGGVTLFITLLAGFAALLHLYTDGTDIVIGTFSPSGRQRAEVQTLMGHFINPVALRLHPRDSLTFRELMHHARDITAGAMRRDLVPLETLIHEITGLPTSGRNPFFKFGISLQPPMPSIAYDWTVSSMDAQSGGAPWNLYVAFIDRPTGMLGRVQYNPDVFEESIVEQMWSGLESLLKMAASHPDEHLSGLRSELRAAPQASL
jgi:hypothetical protein